MEERVESNESFSKSLLVPEARAPCTDSSGNLSSSCRNSRFYACACDGRSIISTCSRFLSRNRGDRGAQVIKYSPRSSLQSQQLLSIGCFRAPRITLRRSDRTGVNVRSPCSRQLNFLILLSHRDPHHQRQSLRLSSSPSHCPVWLFLSLSSSLLPFYLSL